MESLKIDKINQERKLPSNIDAEQALIGSVLVNNDIIDEVASIVNFNEFYDPVHSKIYSTIEKLHNKGMIANPITLKTSFEKDDNLSEVGGTEYLVKLTRLSSSVKQSIDYAKIIHEKFVKRELFKISEYLVGVLRLHEIIRAFWRHLQVQLTITWRMFRCIDCVFVK